MFNLINNDTIKKFLKHYKNYKLNNNKLKLIL